ncbi:MAG: SH3 domain-containing protein [Moraxella sp.]|nr:SH3 domain-containing protein [Moraxella sp.]MDO4450076.1 SH3 domain-containing protein [Moraxella sp.]
MVRMPSGSDVRVLEERNVGGWLWYKVRFAGTTGWARADYICG